MGSGGPKYGVAGPGSGGAASGGFGSGGSGSGAAGPAGPVSSCSTGPSVVFGRAPGRTRARCRVPAGPARPRPGRSGRGGPCLVRRGGRELSSTCGGRFPPPPVPGPRSRCSVSSRSSAGRSRPGGRCARWWPRGSSRTAGRTWIRWPTAPHPPPSASAARPTPPTSGCPAGIRTTSRSSRPRRPARRPTPDSCRDLVERLTAMRDPTGDGRLAVGVDGSGDGACRVRVVGAQRLTATLLGRGDAPLLPLARADGVRTGSDRTDSGSGGRGGRCRCPGARLGGCGRGGRRGGRDRRRPFRSCRCLRWRRPGPWRRRHPHTGSWTGPGVPTCRPWSVKAWMPAGPRRYARNALAAALAVGSTRRR